MVNEAAWRELKKELDAAKVTLVAVSKTKPAAEIQELYDLGQRDFGENYVQELVDKQALPADIQWHYIGHLQTNKVKYIAPFIHLVHAVDSQKLLDEINKQAYKNNRFIDVLLQLHIAKEETKFGLDEVDIMSIAQQYLIYPDVYAHVRIRGLMGMASLTEDTEQVRKEFQQLQACFRELKEGLFLNKPYFDTCSMGMSADYQTAIAEGSTMVRIGSMLFGARDNSNK